MGRPFAYPGHATDRVHLGSQPVRAATFTTYINAQTDPGLEQAFNRQAQIATSSYATITRAAEQATRATAGLLGARGSQGVQQGTTNVQQRATALRTVAAAAAEAERSTARLTSATARHSAQTAVAARQHEGLARGLTTTSVALNVVSGRLDPVASRIGVLTRAVTDLTGVQLGLAAFGATLFAIGRTANNYANLEARVRPFFETQKQVNAAMNDIVGIAQRSRSALEPVVDVYTRLTTVGQNIGLSRGRIAQVTELATKASTLGGGTAQARDAALLQFGQALSGDFKAAGQEINSLKEQAPILFQAILKGFKNADGTIGTSLANFKKLAEAGELSTARVLDALQRSASYIDTMAARIPNTLNKAGTDLLTSVTVSFGQFDKAIGFTGTLADGISVIARNMRVLISLAAGVGTAFAAIKLGGLVAEGAAAVRTFVTMRAAADMLATRRKAAAVESQAQHVREIAALNAEQAEIRENIALLERQRAVASRDVTRYQPGPGYAGSSRLAAAAAQEERAAVRALIQERQRLGIISNALTGAQLRQAAAQARVDLATGAAARRVGLLRSAMGGLVTLLGGPLMIAFAAAATAAYLLATAETAAEKATRLHEDAQRSFANIIDRSTGKVYDQIGALQRLSVQQKATNSGRAAYDAIVAGKTSIGETVSRAARLSTTADANRTPEQRRVAEALANFQANGRGALPQLQGVLADPKIRAAIPALSAATVKLGDMFDGLRTNIDNLGQSAAATRVVRGQARANDVSRALGEVVRTTNGSGAQPKPRTRAQIDAAAATEAASTDVERARAAYKTLQSQRDTKTGLLPGRDDAQTQHELAAALQAVTAAEKGARDARASATAGRAAERKAARDAIQDAKDEAQAKADAALTALERNKPNLGDAQYRVERVKILATYDAEMSKIDASAAASHRASSQRLADARAETAAAAKAAEKRADILSGYDDAPKAIDRARDQIDDLRKFVGSVVDGAEFIGKTKAEIAAIKEINPLGTGIYTREMADADAARIEEGVRKPLRDLDREFNRSAEISGLLLQGRDAEAAAVEKRNRLLDDGVGLTQAEYQHLVDNERQQGRINDALASRQRIVGEITNALDGARDTVESVLTGIQTGVKPGDIFKTAYNDFRNQFAKINSRQLTEKLFAGSDEKLRSLLEGKSGVDNAISTFSTSINRFDSQANRGVSALEKFALAAEGAAGRLDGVDTGGGAGDLAETGGGTTVNDIGDIIVTARKVADRRGIVAPEPGRINIPLETGRALPGTGRLPTARQTYNAVGASIFGGIGKTLDGLADKVLGKKATFGADGTQLSGSTFFKKMGDSFGTALQGAGTGAIASGFAKALGVKQSGTGAQIGGAIGALSGIPGGSIIGGLLGGTIGGLFKKTKQASTTISLSDTGDLITGQAVGTGKDQKATATALGGGVIQGLQNIADSLGAQITGAGSVSIGYRPGHKAGAYRVDTTGQGRLTGVNAFETEAEAIQFAIQDALKDGVITGISNASKKILASGQDLQKALAKATVIESIPKRLLQLTDPVRYAVTNLNDEFKKMISYLKEGGATAEQFADAQKLYDLERKTAIEQASQQAADQIDQFLKDMVGGSNSPLNKRTTFDNAAKDLEAFKADIAAGKVVDQSALLSSARNFQDASRALNGSSQSFFDDFEMLRGLLAKARDNAGITDVSNLPASPFTGDSAVQSALASIGKSQVAATQSQTDVLAGRLDSLITAVNNLGVAPTDYPSYTGGSSIGLLPGFQSKSAY